MLQTRGILKIAKPSTKTPNAEGSGTTEKVRLSQAVFALLLVKRIAPIGCVDEKPRKTAALLKARLLLSVGEKSLVSVPICAPLASYAVMLSKRIWPGLDAAPVIPIAFHGRPVVSMYMEDPKSV